MKAPGTVLYSIMSRVSTQQVNHHKPNPLHPLPIPEQHGYSIAIDFIGPLPVDAGFNPIITFMNHLNLDLQIVSTRTTLTVEGLAKLFFDRWYCENGLPLKIILDQDKLFMSHFWKALHSLTGIKLKMSTVCHPETDGSSEQTNKTVIQAIQFHVRRNQKGWVCALPRIHFDIMNIVNKSTGFSPFQLHFWHSPRILPPIVKEKGRILSGADLSAQTVINHLVHDV